MLIRPSIRQKDKVIKAATGAVNYVLSNFDANKQKRAVAPKIIEGDPDLIRAYDKHSNSPSKNKSTSGVIAFRDKEQLKEEQKERFLERWKDLALGKFQEKVDMLIVEHQDKGNLEFHFIIPHLTNEGERFNPYPGYRKKGEKYPFWCEANLAVQRVLNDEFNFNQVLANNKKQGLTNDEAKENKYHPKEHYKTKKELMGFFIDEIALGHINNKNDLVKNIKSWGFEVARNGENYISIKNPKGGKNLRFEGGVFSNNSNEEYKKIQADKATRASNKQLKKQGEAVNNYTPEQKQADLKTIELYQQCLIDRYENKSKQAEQITITETIENEENDFPNWKNDKNDLTAYCLAMVEKGKFSSRDALVSYLEENGLQVEMPYKRIGEHMNTKYVDITLTGGEKYRFAGSIFMTNSDWIYEKSDKGKFDIEEQAQFIDVFDVIEKGEFNKYKNNNYKNTIFISRANNNISNSIDDCVKSNQQAIFDIDILGPADDGGSSKGMSVEAAAAAYVYAVNTHGPGSKQARQAKAQLEKAQQMEEEQKAARDRARYERAINQANQQHKKRMRI